MELKNGFDSNYRYIHVAARRARQLQSGAHPLIETSSTKPCRIAEQEIQADKIQWTTRPPEVDAEAVEEPGGDD